MPPAEKLGPEKIVWDEHRTAGHTAGGRRVRIWRNQAEQTRVVEIAEPPGSGITARFTACPTHDEAIAFAEAQIGAPP